MPDEEQVVSKSTCTDKESSSPVATSIFTAMRYLGEICLVILALVSYVSLQKGWVKFRSSRFPRLKLTRVAFLFRALKVQLQPLPVPFFFANTSVNDFYRGDISTPFSAVIASDVSLVMYYAPWDFDSQLARAAMDRIALKYKGQVGKFYSYCFTGSNFLLFCFSQGLRRCAELLGPEWRLPSKLF